MKVFVTGANGYIGRHVVGALLQHGHEVIANDFSFQALPDTVTHSTADIFSGRETIYEEIGKPDAVIHLAWKDGFVHNSDEHMKNLSQHYTFLTNLVKGGLPSLSVMGTMHEVGYFEGEINGEVPCNPLSQYGIAKNALRQSLFLAAKGSATNVKWLRAYYIYGDDARSNSIFAKIVRAYGEGKRTFPLNSGKNQYDFIHVDTLGEQIALASVQNAESGIINTCTGKPVSLLAKIREFLAENGMSDMELQIGVFPDRPYDSPAVWGNAEAIQKIMH